MRKLFSALALVVAIAGLGQAAPAAKAGAGATNTVAAKRGLTDAQIEQAIKAKLAKSKVSADHFTVSVRNGVATFEGKTGVIQHKGVATRMAKSSGAIAVENHIQISEEAKTKAAAKLANHTGQPQVARATVVQTAKP